MSNQLVLSTPSEMFKYLEKSKSAIERALPKHISPDRMLRLALTCFSTTPALRECTANSILASIVTASQLGLEIGVRGQGYLIPYKQTCTFVPGWMGLVGLLNNTGRATAWTGAVYEGDIWEYELGSTPKCYHKPGKNYGIVDCLQWVYACGKVNGSEQPVVEAWPIDRVLGHRDKFNKVGKKHYSFENIEMYARKVVLLQVLKYMPCSVELTNAVEVVNRVENGGAGVVIDGGVVVEQQPDEPEDNVPMGGSTPADAPPEGQGGKSDYSYSKALRGLFPLANITEAEFLAYAHKQLGWPDVTNLDAVSLAQLKSVHDGWQGVVSIYQKAKKSDGKLSPQAELEAIYTGGGFTFQLFTRWLEESGNFPDASSLPSISELPKEVATRLIKASKGMLAQLSSTKALTT